VNALLKKFATAKDSSAARNCTDFNKDVACLQLLPEEVRPFIGWRCQKPQRRVDFEAIG